jgi:hypothetical protein
LLFPTTIEKAVSKEGWDDIFLIEMVNEDTALVYMEEEKGEIRLATVNEVFFGWKVIDTAGVVSVSDNAQGFSGMAGRIKIDNDNELNYLLGIITDEKVDKLVYKSNELSKEKTINIFSTIKGTRIYYTNENKEIKDITYVAYSNQGDILYSKP